MPVAVELRGDQPEQIDERAGDEDDRIATFTSRPRVRA